MQWYAAFEAARVSLLASNGKRAAIGQFSTGVPGTILHLDLPFHLHL
jgi:hypothetical protein